MMLTGGLKIALRTKTPPVLRFGPGNQTSAAFAEVEPASFRQLSVFGRCDWLTEHSHMAEKTPP